MPRLFLCAALVLAACHRQEGPDAHYQKAQQLFSQLYATQLDDAYGDPQMDTVVSELKQVNPRSVDADAAKGMLDSIGRGRDALAKQRADREKLGQAAQQSYTTPSTTLNPAAILAADQPDAGPPQDPYGEGADISTVNAQSGGCVNSYEPFNEQGTGTSGTVYRVVPSDECKARLPGFVGQAVLVVNGKIYRRIPDPNPPAPPKPKAAAVAPDAGTPAQAAQQPRPSQPQQPAAGQTAPDPDYTVVVPGGPQPGAQPPAQEPQGVQSAPAPEAPSTEQR